MNPQKRRAIFECFSQHNHRPVTELVYSTPYELLVAVMLSAQMTDKGVNRTTAKLFPLANTPKKIIKLGLNGLMDLLKNINYYKTKARNVMNTSHILISDFKGKVPDTQEDLQKLPGVGRKTANVILSVAYHKPVIAVDTHVYRVANRTKLAPGKTVQEVENNLMKKIPPEYLQNAHHWLVLHGRYVCTARNPHCKQCIISHLCEYSFKNLES
jgi:endonuclease-3